VIKKSIQISDEKMNLEKYTISNKESIKTALKKIDLNVSNGLIVLDDFGKVCGTITDGDIRRSILGGKDINSGIDGVYNLKPKLIAQSDYSIELARKALLKDKLSFIPVINENDILVNFITWSFAFTEDQAKKPIKKKIDIPVVIMAGGKGTRLDPFTRIFPKALVPVGEQTIIELIINNFEMFGVNDFNLIVNYKGNLIEAFFSSLELDSNVNFIHEKKFMGTAGSLPLIEKYIKDDFILSNCDIIVEADYGEILDFHRKENADLTIISSIKHYKIPYGVIKFKKGGEIVEIVEKPEYVFPINAGVYVLNKKVLDYIAKEKYLDMNTLIETLLENNRKVITFPLNESCYLDIGEWEEYKKTIKKFIDL
jgi:dTDP-glucose pyrophosphorylase/predicted transcriptional regulator